MDPKDVAKAADAVTKVADAAVAKAADIAKRQMEANAAFVKEWRELQDAVVIPELRSLPVCTNIVSCVNAAVDMCDKAHNSAVVSKVEGVSPFSPSGAELPPMATEKPPMP